MYIFAYIILITIIIYGNLFFFCVKVISKMPLLTLWDKLVV